MLRRRLLAVLVVLTMVLTLAAPAAFAVETQEGTVSPVQQIDAGEEAAADQLPVPVADEDLTPAEEPVEVPGEKVPEEEDGNDDSNGGNFKYKINLHSQINRIASAAPVHSPKV